MSNYEVAGSLGLQGKTVAVVGGGGANNGIGRATAILFAQLGAKIAVLEAATETARLINAVAENAASVWLLDALNADQLIKL
jgi:NAD(P)-dependent dehydrogenase (short-subunit alcohol dehydrogenase family)